MSENDPAKKVLMLEDPNEDGRSKLKRKLQE
jgi:hypothetical protein